MTDLADLATRLHDAGTKPVPEGLIAYTEGGMIQAWPVRNDHEHHPGIELTFTTDDDGKRAFTMTLEMAVALRRGLSTLIDEMTVDLLAEEAR